VFLAYIGDFFHLILSSEIRNLKVVVILKTK